jgi:two-component system sensor histidine kinase KdpD
MISQVSLAPQPRRILSDLVERPGPFAGVVASAGAVALVTAVIALLDRWIPVLSLAVLYVFAVLPIAVVWGLAYSVCVSVAAMLAFNFFFLPPLYTLTLADSRNWFALLVFVVTSIVVSALAARSRWREREASLLAEIATSLLEHGTVEEEIERISAEAARALHADGAVITLGAEPTEGYALAAGGRRVGTIALHGDAREAASARRRILPALASLLGVAIDRERLEREAFEAEALRRADAIKTALLRSVSHDLRTPLMAISTAAGALASPELAIDSEGRDELLSTILAASARLDHLVSNLLDLSRLQAGAAEPRRELIDVDELVVAALAELGVSAGRVEVSLPDEPPSVEVDGHQVQRVLVNLIENALKYSPADEPVRVQVGPTAAEVVIRVVDHGRGVLPAERQRIFEPFQRGEPSGEASGAGLGLAIARGFAEANGGRLSVESRLGQGATFVLGLPLAGSRPPLRPARRLSLGATA